MNTASTLQPPQTISFADLALLSNHTTAQAVFSEAINIAANFGIDDGHAGLKHLANPANGISQLCGPTMLADFIVYSMGITKSLPVSTKVPGVSHDLQSIDVNLLVADLAKRCKTDVVNGTNGEDLIAAIGPAIQDYFGKSVRVDLFFGSSNKELQFPSYVAWLNQPIDFGHIKDAIRNGDPVLTQIDWESYAADGSNPHPAGGHFFPIYGFAWQKYFANHLLQLAITDTAPISGWSVNQEYADYNAVSAFRDNLADHKIFLDGRGFNGQKCRAFLGYAVTIKIL